ncbi:MAG: cupredoxin domain-containing protein [Deltaproteobacteria bacterium]|nr:cupredoxin domain-containing protein [Deltaproteobacteria bacterium]
MKFKRLSIGGILALALFFASGNPSYGANSEIVKGFIEALESNNAIKMSQIIEDNKAKIPAEIKALLIEAAAPKISREEMEAKFYIAELMAREYKDVSGDTAVLVEVKKTIFNSKLSSPVRSSAINGAHEVRLPKATAATKNVFVPDNVIIKKGETVRWINDDSIAHIFSSMRLIGMSGISSSSVEPGKSYEYKFEKPGDYYYICFIHSGMVGKITVE